MAVQASAKGVAEILLASLLAMLILVVCLVIWLKSSISKKAKKKSGSCLAGLSFQVSKHDTAYIGTAVS